MMSNGDIMGGVNSILETMNSGVAMFINGDAGDIAPSKSLITIIILQMETYNLNSI